LSAARDAPARDAPVVARDAPARDAPVVARDAPVVVRDTPMGYARVKDKYSVLSSQLSDSRVAV
jgi:hypothetical protein